MLALIDHTIVMVPTIAGGSCAGRQERCRLAGRHNKLNDPVAGAVTPSVNAEPP